MATKTQLIAGMKLNKAVIAHERATVVNYSELSDQKEWKYYPDSQDWKHVDKWERRHYFLPNPTDHIQIVSHGYIAFIFSSGRVTLDTFGISTPCGSLFDGQVKDGLTLEQIRSQGVKLLHGAIRKSGLKD